MNQEFSYGNLSAEINTEFASMGQKQVVNLLFTKDPSLWKMSPDQTEKISQLLGWLSFPVDFEKNVETLIEFATTIKEEGYTNIVLLEMGGGSLFSEVARETFNTPNGYPQLFVLDNTDPAAIKEIENKINPEKTLFIVASRLGKTEETMCFFNYFYNQLEKRNYIAPGANFIAITETGSPLVRLAEEMKFRRVFITPPNPSGAYSVLSDYGLVPMALMGIDIQALLANALQMKSNCESLPVTINPGVSLGVVLGICQQYGRDKVTFILSASINSFAYWLEQLLAESTGKDGLGLIPVHGEFIGTPDSYGTDRLFIHMYIPSDYNEEDEQDVKALEDAGHPIVRIKVADKIALGGELYKWEIATAIAGLVMGVNPFDWPNVGESKRNTNIYLKEWDKEGSFKKADPLIKSESISIFIGRKPEYFANIYHDSLGCFVNSFTEKAWPDEYIAILPYFHLSDYRKKLLQTWRQQLRDELKVATTLLSGPRYLYSTGQLHKGGPNSGLFILLTGCEEFDLAIPGKAFGFAAFNQALALGDFQSLNNLERRVIRIQFGKNIDSGLTKLMHSIKEPYLSSSNPGRGNLNQATTGLFA